MNGFAQTTGTNNGHSHSQLQNHPLRSRTNNLQTQNPNPTPTSGLSVNGTTCSNAATAAANIMSQISEISEGLYLCGARAINIDKLRDLGITTIFNVTIELPSLLIDKTEYVKISIEDSPSANLSQYFDKVADKIDEVRRRGGKVLVHCVAGVSRSASLCIAYLMKHKNMQLRRAYLHVKARRPIIRPNPGFFRQLVEFEMRLYGCPTVRMVWNEAAGGQIPDVYEPEYNNTVNFIKKYGAHMDRLGRASCVPGNNNKSCSRSSSSNNLFR